MNISLPFKISILAAAVALTACGGDDKKKSAPKGLANNSLGEFVISTKGGDSAGYIGGSAGNIEIAKSRSNTPLVVRKNGMPNTNYKLPQQDVDLGTNAVVVSADKLLEEKSNISGLSDGDLYLYTDNTISSNARLYKFVTGGEHADRAALVTGLTIDAGATLSLPNGGGELNVLNDIVNNGTIDVDVDAADTDRGDLVISAAAYYGTGKITTSGTEKGQDGGDIELSAFTIVNSGEINTSGANNSETSGNMNGGDAGSIEFNGQVFIENKGQIVATGGNSAEGQAGDSASSIDISATYIYNTADINMNDGSGQTASTGSATLDLTASEQLINTGNLSANGSSDTANGGYGRNGGNIYLTLSEGSGFSSANQQRQFINTGDISSKGGDTSSTSSSDYAGSAGSFEIYVEDAVDNDNSTVVAPALVVMSGNINLDGGRASENGARGGQGGDVEFEFQSNLDATLPTYFVGYKEINTSGGAGVKSGSGGQTLIASIADSDAQYYPGGSINIDTDFIANAGAVKQGSNPTTGSAGRLTIMTTSEQPYLQDMPMAVEFDGSFTANASVVNEAGSSNSNVTGGIFGIQGEDDVRVNADITTNGSDVNNIDANSNSNAGTNAGFALITSRGGNVSARVEMQANGGNSDLLGGRAGMFMTQAAKNVSVKGTFNAVGGNADAGSNSSQTIGGNGGRVMVINTKLNASSSLEITNNGGTGYRKGFDGAYVLNSDCEGVCNLENIEFPSLTN